MELPTLALIHTLEKNKIFPIDIHLHVHSHSMRHYLFRVFAGWMLSRKYRNEGNPQRWDLWECT
jgi:hypothetical protein